MLLLPPGLVGPGNPEHVFLPLEPNIRDVRGFVHFYRLRVDLVLREATAELSAVMKPPKSSCFTIVPKEINGCFLLQMLLVFLVKIMVNEFCFIAVGALRSGRICAYLQEVLGWCRLNRRRHYDRALLGCVPLLVARDCGRELRRRGLRALFTRHHAYDLSN